MKNLRCLIPMALLLIIVASACNNNNNNNQPSTCTNGIKDGTETDVDCGGLCNPCVGTDSFYISYKLGNNSIYYTSPTFQLGAGCSHCLSGLVMDGALTGSPSQAYTRIGIEFAGSDTISDAEIFALKGQTIDCQTFKSVFASFFHKPSSNDPNTYMYAVDNATGNTITITDVQKRTHTLADRVFLISGTFTLTVRDYNLSDHQVTNGNFRFRFGVKD